MLVDIDLDYSNRLVSGPGTRDLLSQFVFKRDTASEIRVRFWSGGLQTELAAGATGKFAIKPLGKYDAEPLVLADTWVKTGTGISTVYTFNPNFDGEALADLLFSGDGNQNNDVTYISAMSEILWEIAGKKNRTQTVNTTIDNDVIKGSDGTPLALPTPDEWLEARRPAPITRTAAQGKPVDGVFAQRHETTGTSNSRLSIVAKADGASGNAITIRFTGSTGSGLGISVAGTAITVTCASVDGVASSSTSAQIKAAIEAFPAAHALVAVSYYGGDNGSGIHNFGGPYNLQTGAGNIATALDQSCIVGDAGGNKLIYRAVQVLPTRWQLITSGVIEDNENPGAFRKLIFDGGAPSSEAYTL